MLYEVIIGNYCDDSTKSKLVLSYDSLDIVAKYIKTMITIDDGEYVHEIIIPKICLSAWTPEEWDELAEIRKQLTGQTFNTF